MLYATDLACERDGRVLFEGLCLALEPGVVCELRGPNGAGKSTLLRILAGLYADYTGSIDDRRASVLYIGHRAGVSPLLSADENLAWLDGLAHGSAADAGRRAEALARVGLGGREQVRLVHMSAGQQRRAALARLVITRARVWLLDEPLTALDADGCALVGQLLVEHAGRGGSALVATHVDLPVPDCQRIELGG